MDTAPHTTAPTNSDSGSYLTLRQAAQLGFVSYSTLRKYITNGQLPSVRRNNRIKVRCDDLERLAVQLSNTPLEEFIQTLVQDAPPLTEAQIARLRLALDGETR